jgi:hypothetical protein
MVVDAPKNGDEPERLLGLRSTKLISDLVEAGEMILSRT